MSEEHPTRRDLMKPAQLLGLSFAAALFAGFVTLISMGFFQQRFATESLHALVVALIVAGITFIVTVVVIALLMLTINPAEITKPLDSPVLLTPEEIKRNLDARKGRHGDPHPPASGPKP